LILRHGFHKQEKGANMKKKTKKNSSPVVNFDGKEYRIDKMTDDQKIQLAHINDLNRKVDASRFNLQQMEVGLNAFVVSLGNALKDVEK
jgi:hypothetical protein